MMTTDPIIERGGAPIVLASLEPPETGRRASIWYATVRFARARGAPLERDLIMHAQVIREGVNVRLLQSSDTNVALVSGWPERAWLAVVGTEIRVMAGTVGAPLRAHLVSFAPITRDKVAERAAVRAENQRAFQAREGQRRALRDLANYSDDPDERTWARLQLEKERTR